MLVLAHFIPDPVGSGVNVRDKIRVEQSPGELNSNTIDLIPDGLFFPQPRVGLTTLFGVFRFYVSLGEMPSTEIS